mmetsp:Transcript_9375/g.22230  ORF Transcript_9375/g.22230 Transcript_9375/m.22230 type:complete len:373 (-) Transcript_9375:1105-2223(-)
MAQGTGRGIARTQNRPRTNPAERGSDGRARRPPWLSLSLSFSVYLAACLPSLSSPVPTSQQSTPLIVRAHDEGHSRECPLPARLLRLQCRQEHVGGSTERCRVHRAVVVVRVRSQIADGRGVPLGERGDGLHVDHRHFGQELLELGVRHHAGADGARDVLLELVGLDRIGPARALNEETVDVRAVFGVVRSSVRRAEHGDMRGRCHVVERHILLPRGHLHDCREERRRVEESRHPGRVRQHKRCRPSVEAVDAREQVGEPGGERLQARPGQFLPRALMECVAARDLVEPEGFGQVLHPLRHVELAIHALAEVIERPADFVHEQAHTPALLHRQQNVRDLLGILQLSRPLTERDHVVGLGHALRQVLEHVARL